MCVYICILPCLQLHLSCEGSNYVWLIVLWKLLTLIALSTNVANKQRLLELSGEEFTRCSSPNRNYNSETFTHFPLILLLILFNWPWRQPHSFTQYIGLMQLLKHLLTEKAEKRKLTEKDMFLFLLLHLLSSCLKGSWHRGQQLKALGKN